MPHDLLYFYHQKFPLKTLFLSFHKYLFTKNRFLGQSFKTPLMRSQPFLHLAVTTRPAFSTTNGPRDLKLRVLFIGLVLLLIWTCENFRRCWRSTGRLTPYHPGKCRNPWISTFTTAKRCSSFVNSSSIPFLDFNNGRLQERRRGHSPPPPPSLPLPLLSTVHEKGRNDVLLSFGP